jgi:hypothetical protein
MTTLTVTPSLFEPVSGEPTLDDLVVSVWEGLIAHRVGGCPVCGHEMEPEYGAHAKPIGGHCAACGSTLR